MPTKLDDLCHAIYVIVAGVGSIAFMCDNLNSGHYGYGTMFALVILALATLWQHMPYHWRKDRA